jgi:hypothetical protein
VTAGWTRHPQWNIKKKGYEARLDAHNDAQLRIVSKSSEAVRIEAHCVRTTGDEDEKKPRNETRDQTGQRIVRDDTARGDTARSDLVGRSD